MGNHTACTTMRQIKPTFGADMTLRGRSHAELRLNSGARFVRPKTTSHLREPAR